MRDKKYIGVPFNFSYCVLNNEISMSRVTIKIQEVSVCIYIYLVHEVYMALLIISKKRGEKKFMCWVRGILRIILL